MNNKLKENIKEHIDIFSNLSALEEDIFSVANFMIETLENNRKIIVAGNGGSMSDAQHFVAELVNSFFNKNRKALNAIALGVNPSIVSAWSNDFDFNEQFSRELDGIGNEGDILFLISTSGNSKNLMIAAKKAKEKGIKIICLLGRDGGKLKEQSDLNIIVPANSTPRIQEAHLLIYHTLAELIEDSLK